MNNRTNKAWLQYEAGMAYKRRIGLYESSRRNDAFYRGEQWQSGEGADLPRPVFNIIRRVVDFLVCSVASADLSIDFSDENLPFSGKEEAKQTEALLKILTQNTAYRWEKDGMDAKLFRLLTDAALCGDGALYCYWDTSARGAGDYSGDIVTEIADATRIFPADVNKNDIQSQEYIILSGRQSVLSLRKEAEQNGASNEDIAKICRDDEPSAHGRRSEYELEGEEEEKTTFIIKFWKENGKVCFEKSTRDCIIKRAHTDCRLYPVAYFNWMPTYGSFHGTAPASGMIANQKFINRAYAMMMKHMTDTAFSQVIYDKSRIPEWTNEVGEAIAAVGGNLADAVQVVGTGHMQDGYMALIESAINTTKEMSGATDTALGSAQASNTSAILALQEASRTALLQVSTAYQQCLEDVADIWADMLCAGCSKERLLPMLDGGERRLSRVDFEALRSGILRAHVEIGNLTQYSASGTQNTLEKLLENGHITLEQYLEQLPAGIMPMRGRLLAQWKEKQKEEWDDGRNTELSDGD